jgi:hypothetical protein
MPKPGMVHVQDSRCWVCKKHHDEVEMMIEASRNYFQFLLCNECIERCNQIIAAKRQRGG